MFEYQKNKIKKINKFLVIIFIGLLFYSSNMIKPLADEENNDTDTNNVTNITEDTVEDDRTNNSDVNKKLDIDLSNINIDDTFKSYDNNEYKISQVNMSIININSEKTDIYNFEIYTKVNDEGTWRKFVKLDDLCKDKNVCELVDDKTDIVLKRTSPLNGKIVDSNSKKLDTYYRTVYDGEKKQFQSVLVIGEKFYKFNFDADEDSKFNEEGILTSDVETLTDKNGDLYVSLRFVTEALGAEVKWTAAKDDESNDTVDINFYDNESYCKNIITSFSDTCNDISDSELDKIEKCDSNDTKCESERCKEYIKNNLNDSSLDNLSLKIDYNYIDENNKIKKYSANWEKENIYQSSDKNIDGYGIILYRSVPLIIDIFNGVDNDECSTEETECLMEGKKYITDEVMINLSGRSGPYCSIAIDEQITTSASR